MLSKLKIREKFYKEKYFFWPCFLLAITKSQFFWFTNPPNRKRPSSANHSLFVRRRRLHSWPVERVDVVYVVRDVLSHERNDRLVSKMRGRRRQPGKSLPLIVSSFSISSRVLNLKKKSRNFPARCKFIQQVEILNLNQENFKYFGCYITDFPISDKK